MTVCEPPDPVVEGEGSEEDKAEKRASSVDENRLHGSAPKNKEEDTSTINEDEASQTANREVVEITCFDDLSPEAKKDVKKIKVDVEEFEEEENLWILLNCLLLLRKTQYVLNWKGQGNMRAAKCQKARRSESFSTEGLLTPITGVIKKELKVRQLAGTGGFGRVYEAKKRKGDFKGKVAIKKMRHSSQKEIASNLKEVYYLKMVSHPNIVKYFSASVIEEEMWILMEYMEGGTLTEATEKYDFEEKDVAYAAKELLKGITYLHKNNLIHRDIKSANVMMTVQGEVKLIDFGLCMEIKGELFEQRSMVGSPYWMPPEMIKREPYGPNVDIWSLAVCLLELINKKPPNRRKGALRAMYRAATVGVPEDERYKKPNKWSRDCKDFMAQMLEVDAKVRPDAEELLQHPFMNKADSQKSMRRILQRIFLSDTMAEIGL
eukprot:CAMPEP_0174255358 /NCGR_PEP_ID=MMETSP0439-20130205/4697_1 /TAXON_ID=0 /ORGANISM="Stereomyxa ramosa, Strain Chinc5" /LENGTH=433 /DNA_ID=CAMNT_0015337503 /DNA_START=158 /DNA_END=1459 /DNA_ORIENTATION=-